MGISLAIVGSREFNDYRLLSDTLARVNSSIDQIVSGGARGADSLARRYAEEHGIPLVEHLPDWDRFGKSAGFRRNKLIVQEADALLAFWDGKSRGTQHSINLARQQKLPLYIQRF